MVLQPGMLNGIKKVSLVRLSKIATVDRSLIVGLIGAISNVQLKELDSKLKVIFQIP